ncbi:MAG: hypothetical protein ACXVNM_01715 [Bacteroidia bacterium]
MSDRPHNKNLEDLLKNFKTQRSEGLDDFEREALEGFDTMHSKQDALDLKSALDKRVHEELFTEKKNGQRIYWFAAAGLFLVIGLSVFFILNNQAVEEKNVAYVQPTDSIEQLKETVTAAPTEEGVTAEPKEEKIKKETSPLASTKTNSNRNNSPGKSEGGGISSRAVLKPAQSDIKTNNENSVVADNRADNDKNDIVSGELNKQSGKDANFETVVDAETKKLEEKNERETISKEKAADQLAFSEAKVRDEEPAKGAKKSYRYKSKEKAPASKAAEDDAKTQPEKTAVNTGIAGNGSYDNKNNNNITQSTTTSPNGSVAEQKATSPAMNAPATAKADEYNSPTNTCYYSGGETVLMKDLREKLTEENVNKKFDVLLNINEKKKVEKVIYLDVYDLTTQERDKVTKILKSLDKFNFYIQPNKKSLFEFKLLYKP